MPRRGENIHKRKDGRWEARYVVKTDEAITKKYRSVYGKTYQEAKEKRNLILQQQPILQKTRCVMFKDILASWQAANSVHLKESSVSRYQNLIDVHILPALGNVCANQLSAATINRFLAQKLENGRANGCGRLSPAYVRSLSVVISSAMKYGIAEGMCHPLRSSLIRPPLPKKELRILSLKEQAVLEQELLDDINEDKLLTYITLYTGLRIGEVCALCWEDIDMDAMILYVRKTVSRSWNMQNQKKISTLQIGSPKTEASLRCIPICSKLYAVLSDFPFKKKHGYISTCGKDESFISPRTFEYRYKKILKACAIEPVNYHALRHTFATRCVERGVDVKSLSEILGHANIAITLNTYVHSSIELKRAQIEKLTQ